MAVFSEEETDGDHSKDEEIFAQSRGARFVGEPNNVRQQKLMPLVVLWPKTCREAWAKGPHYQAFPIYRVSQNLANIHIETEIIRRIVTRHPEAQRIMNIIMTGCLLFFGVTLSTTCVRSFTGYLIKHGLLRDTIIGTIGEHIELSSWIAGEARRQVKNGDLRVKQTIGQLCNHMGKEESERLTEVMTDAAEKCRLMYDVQECLLPAAAMCAVLPDIHDEPRAQDTVKTMNLEKHR